MLVEEQPAQPMVVGRLESVLLEEAVVERRVDHEWAASMLGEDPDSERTVEGMMVEELEAGLALLLEVVVVERAEPVEEEPVVL